MLGYHTPFYLHCLLNSEYTFTWFYHGLPPRPIWIHFSHHSRSPPLGLRWCPSWTNWVGFRRTVAFILYWNSNRNQSIVLTLGGPSTLEIYQLVYWAAPHPDQFHSIEINWILYWGYPHAILPSFTIENCVSLSDSVTGSPLTDPIIFSTKRLNRKYECEEKQNNLACYLQTCATIAERVREGVGGYTRETPRCIAVLDHAQLHWCHATHTTKYEQKLCYV